MYADCVFEYGKPLMECLGEKGIKSSLQRGAGLKSIASLKIRRHRVAAVVLLDGLNLTDTENILQIVYQFCSGLYRNLENYKFYLLLIMLL